MAETDIGGEELDEEEDRPEQDDADDSLGDRQGTDPVSYPPSLSGDFVRALRAQGFSELTEVQQAVLTDELAGRDLRISSQTGSGKTVALGFVVAGAFTAEGAADELTAELPEAPRKARTAAPRVLVVAPTRELASQLGQELSWLYGQLHVGIAVVTGGTSVGGDLRALAEGPGMVIGTPGRLIDHLDRGSLDLSNLAEVVLDEADEMLDMGFREELESILDRTPEKRRTHLVSATFTPRVRALADRYQQGAVLVEGIVGAKHQDISHTVMVVDARERTNALINLLLLRPDERFLVFVRTRVAASEVAGELAGLGFSASPLSGEMAQRERTRCLADFRAHKLQCVVATDVAARGLDIRGVQKVVHYDLPDSLEAFTHRSGRTGRAGDKGESIILVAPRGKRRVEELFRITKVEVRWGTPPTPEQIRKASRRRLVRKYGAVDPTEAPDAAASSADPAASSAPEELRQLAEQLLERRPAAAIIADMLHDIGAKGPTEPREIRAHGGEPRRQTREAGHNGRFVPFHVTWGFKTGANAKRLLAHVCRRGGINGHQVGTINIHEFRAVVDVAADAAEAFERAVARPDPRNPRVRIQRFVPLEQRERRRPSRK